MYHLSPPFNTMSSRVVFRRKRNYALDPHDLVLLLWWKQEDCIRSPNFQVFQSTGNPRSWATFRSEKTQKRKEACPRYLGYVSDRQRQPCPSRLRSITVHNSNPGLHAFGPRVALAAGCVGFPDSWESRSRFGPVKRLLHSGRFTRWTNRMTSLEHPVRDPVRTPCPLSPFLYRCVNSGFAPKAPRFRKGEEFSNDQGYRE
jgi:hypothetical protein